MRERLEDVLDAIYAAYGVSWEAISGAATGAPELTEEALFLCRLITQLLPDEPEPRGLRALLLYCESRRSARRGQDGQFIPLSEQNTRLWSRDMIIEAENQLTLASRHKVLGRYQCEAAIQSVHAQRAITGKTHFEALLALYQLLAIKAPSVGVYVSQAAVTIEAGQPDQALAQLKQLEPADITTYQPYWVTLARAYQAVGEETQAVEAYRTAVGLTEDPGIRTYLRTVLFKQLPPL
jgi:RNA polymerase sigma-70 factor (ECF subfamily)